MIVTDLKNGTIFKENGHPFVVVKYQHVKVSRGSAQVRIKMKDLITGQVLEKSWQSTAHVEDTYVETKNAQYLYRDGDTYNFMDPDTYEQFNISEDTIGFSAQFLKDGEKVQILYFEDRPVSVDLPVTVTFKVTYTEPGFKGHTVSNV